MGELSVQERRERFLIQLGDHIEKYLHKTRGATPRVSKTSLARRLGVERTTLHKWLAGINTIPLDALQKLCAILDLDMETRHTLLQLHPDTVVIEVPAPASSSRDVASRSQREVAQTRATLGKALAAQQPELPGGTVTFLFTDVEGSTRHWEQYRQAMPIALAHLEALLRRIVSAHGGAVFKTVGDGVCAVFSNALEGLHAALASQRALMTEPWNASGLLRVRMALHTGIVEPHDDDYMGLPLSRVARLMAAGHGGQILLSRVTQELVRDQLPPEVDLRCLGEYHLKDLTHSEHIYQLVAPDLISDFPPLRTHPHIRHNLPEQSTMLIGREHEVVHVKHLLQRADVRLVTLIGPGGVGKTRLALEVASKLLDEFADGIWVVELGPIREHSLVVPTVVQTLNVREASPRPLLNILKDYLRDKQLLLVLDNFEHVAREAPLIRELLATAPKLKVLVTSRILLHLSLEHTYSVPTLALPDLHHLPSWDVLAQVAAVHLFLQRAWAVKPEFSVTEANALAIATICTRLDGLPLAIELAAVHIRACTPQGLLKLLAPRLPMLMRNVGDAPIRHQTLRNTIAWSYELLDVAVQRLFRWLAVFAGGCRLETIEAVYIDGAMTPLVRVDGQALPTTQFVFQGLAILVDHHLLQLREDSDGEPRYIMLETIREYALQQLEQSSDELRVRQRHADYYLTLVETAVQRLTGPEQQIWMERLEADHDNCRAVLAWSLAAGDIQSGVRLASALGRFWFIRGYWSEGRSWLTRAMASASHMAPTWAYAKALYEAGYLASYQQDFTTARAQFEESIAIYTTLNDSCGIAYGLYGLGLLATWHDEHSEAVAQFERSLELFRSLKHVEGTATALSSLAGVMGAQGNYERSAALFEESLALVRTLGDSRGIALVLRGLGLVAKSRGDFPQAEILLGESLVLYRKLNHKVGMCIALNGLGDVAMAQEKYARARTFHEECLAVSQEIEHKRGIALALNSLGCVAYLQGETAQASEFYRRALTLYQISGDKEGIASAVEGLAGVAGADHQFERMARLWGIAEHLRDTIGAPLPATGRAYYERHIAAAHAQIGPATWDEVCAKGRAMPLEQALIYALASDTETSPMDKQVSSVAIPKPHPQ